ncbi:MAG: 50S ribosomal protein L4 [Nanoarchaeota archaeon]
MKADLFDVDGKKLRTIELPEQFNEEVRSDLIQRAVLAIQANSRQPYGAFPQAGMRQSVEVSRRRRKYRGSYGHGISRVPRKVLWKRGRQFGWVGAFSPATVGGRRAHPPKSEKVWDVKINLKERRKAIRSALAATLSEFLVKKRGHRFKQLIPVIDSKAEAIFKTKEILSMLNKLGLEEELSRTKEKRIRPGRGKTRGRPYQEKKGPLIVVSSKCNLLRSAKNIPGVDVCVVSNLNAELLAPGSHPGRLTIFTERSIELMSKNNLFMNETKSEVKTPVKRER